MSNQIIVSCLQYTSLQDERGTIEKINNLVKEAVSRNSDLVALPECSTFIYKEKANTLQKSKLQKDSFTIHEICRLAKTYGINILIGSLQTKLRKNSDLLVNRSYLVNSYGKVTCKYDKIHMFDVKLSYGQEFNESKIYTPGKEAKISKIKIRNNSFFLGLTICYDLRFPNLYQDLAKAGAQIISVPSAFTKTTGKAHWLTLLRARAIETGCFVIAPAQIGQHYSGRESYGHSLIINPWGKILANAKTKESIITSKINIDDVNKSREKISNLINQREYSIKY